LLRRHAQILLERIEHRLDAAFGADANPLKQLGALGWYFYWVVVASGIYVYIFYDSGVTEAYQSVEYMTHVQWYAAGVMRSLHRYASDALVLAMALHLAREFVKDRYRGVRWFAWVTGVAIVWFVYASGISGYWVVWDRFAQYLAIATSEWLDALGIFGDPVARNFVHDSRLSGRFFTLMVFIHIAVPLVLLFLLWLHSHRLAQARVNPPRALALGCTAMLLGVAIARPAVSQGPADLGHVPAQIALDWFYAWGYPLLDRMPLAQVWLLALGATVLAALLPWLPRRRERPAAAVDLDNCNGCARCFADCPYSAITMVPRTDGRPYERQAQVEPALCIACGICAGACPTATPYRRRSRLRAGIELPWAPVSALRDEALAEAAALGGAGRIIVFGCAPGPDLERLRDRSTAAITLPCVGALPPPFIDFLLARGHVDGVMLTGCPPGDCAARLGIAWSAQRLARERDPRMRQRVPRERVATCWAGRSGRAMLRQALARFRDRLDEHARLAAPAERVADGAARPAAGVHGV
jgi:ferredoxin/coenzyme F420-reducing hydrogenase delta subunit